METGWHFDENCSNRRNPMAVADAIQSRPIPEGTGDDIVTLVVSHGGSLTIGTYSQRKFAASLAWAARGGNPVGCFSSARRTVPASD